MLMVSAHALIWPAKEEPRDQAGAARTVSETQAFNQEAAYEALNGTAAPATAGHTGTQSAALPPPGLPGAQQGEAFGQPGPSSARPAEPQLSPRQKLAIASRRAPIMAFAGGLGSPFAASASPGTGSPAAAGEAGLTSGEAGASHGAGGGFLTSPANTPASFASRIPASSVEVARASIIGDRNFLIAAGRTIPCTLQTAINSTQAGIVSCVIGKDIYSENGRVVMLDKGTRVLGEYTGGIRQGQARLFVVWTRALTPRGVIIDLASPASDALGRAGIGGGVDTKFWDRFGAALMFSVLEDAASVASSHFAGYGTNTTQVPAQTSAAAMNGAQNIQPVLKANQGQSVAIEVARDFDFGSVYDVKVKTPGEDH
ncbi:MAG: type IV secretion system protein VirB10 [Sphingomonadales bacterium]|nr:type IV secretion system protein VirB10 [Sphingomonadales bacterium]MDE2570750.1 type IV secretion system protein VirB10 [Sphingomonadales bacterium]